MNDAMRMALVRLLRNVGAMALIVAADSLAQDVGIFLPDMNGIPVALIAAPLLNAVAKWGRTHLDDGVARRACKLL